MKKPRLSLVTPSTVFGPVTRGKPPLRRPNAESRARENDGRTLIMKHRDGEKTIPVPANVRVVIVVPATVADIKAGQNFFVPNGYQTSLGTEALTIIVGSNSVDFAM